MHFNLVYFVTLLILFGVLQPLSNSRSTPSSNSVYDLTSQQVLCSTSAGKCTGSSNCRACTNCKYCKHCNAGGSCGVCGKRSQTSRKQRYSQQSNQYQLTEASPLRSYPDSSAPSIKYLEVNEEVKVIDDSNEYWWKVSYGGKVGWVKKRSLKKKGRV